MDILNTYTESKEALAIIAKELFSKLESDDPFNTIRHSDITRLEIVEHPKDDNLVKINLLNHSDEIPKVTFEALRADTLNLGDDVMHRWHIAAMELITLANRLKVAKFLRDFGADDFPLFNVLLTNYDALAKRGLQDREIAHQVAVHQTRIIAQKVLKRDVHPSELMIE